ncbi:MAG: type I-E CRISPR-associated endonuclease Cas1 [Candidatus Methanomethylophilaceae archaeon]|nr:type I-E CRISPR-associated endonuclease Cas1 [Candidatus Methanomethylophilaceae archaeon]
MVGHGAPRPEIQELPRIGDRMSFLYLEHCKITRDDSGISVSDSRGTFQIPIAAISLLMLGPGTSITHRAMELIGDAGTGVSWVGDGALKCYAFGKPLTHSSTLLEYQAKAVSNTRLRMTVARKMYQMRFPDEDVSRLTMQQLRGREGSRVRKTYREESKRTGVAWSGRQYSQQDHSSDDIVNTSLSMANSFLYGIAFSIIMTMGCSPGLGFVHTGHERSFVFDISDLYKTETSIPVAFDVAAMNPKNVWATTRALMKKAIRERHIVERMPKDIRFLLSGNNEEDGFEDVVVIWDPLEGFVPSGRAYDDRSEG